MFTRPNGSTFRPGFRAGADHTDAQAAASARAERARAYTLRADVVFGAGQYALEQAEGKLLLAHEMAHVVQQRNGLLGRVG
jgi:hypothetical protein